MPETPWAEKLEDAAPVPEQRAQLASSEEPDKSVEQNRVAARLFGQGTESCNSRGQGGATSVQNTAASASAVKKDRAPEILPSSFAPTL